MSQDLTLKTQLTADAGPLNAALRQAGGEVQKYGETAQQASAAAAAAARDAAAATGAELKALLRP